MCSSDLEQRAVSSTKVLFIYFLFMKPGHFSFFFFLLQEMSLLKQRNGVGQRPLKWGGGERGRGKKKTVLSLLLEG